MNAKNGVLLAMVGLAAVSANAETIAIGVNETGVVENHDDRTLTESVVTAPGGRLAKIGEGELTVPLGAFSQKNEACVDVREGTVKIDAWEAGHGPSEPDDVLSRAALWLDASAEATVKRDGEGNVTAWLDRRETGNESSGYVCVRALPNLIPANKRPTFVEKDGKKALYFGGYKSGITTDWRNPDGSLKVISGIRHVFLVTGVYNTWGFILGGTGKGDTAEGTICKFRIGDENNGSPTAAFFWKGVAGSGAEAPNTARVYLNGERIEAITATPLAGQFQLLELDCCGTAGEASNFFNDRNYFASNPELPSRGGDRIGGDYISEAVIFTCELTEAERLAVGNWLMNKWFGTTRPNVRFSVAANAGVNVESAGLGEATIEGNGSFVKKGTGNSVLTATPTTPARMSVRVEEGTLEMSPALPLQLSDGDRYTVNEPDYASPSVSRAADAGAGKVVKDGSGVARIETLPSSVSKLAVAEGTVVLSAPHQAAEAKPWNPLAATVPNGSFSGWSDSKGYVEIQGGRDYANWHIEVTNPSSDTRDRVIFTGGDGTGKEWASFADPYGVPLPSPDGGNIMLIKGNTSAWTELTVSKAGSFDVCFDTNARKYWNNPITLDVCIRDANGGVAIIGSFSQMWADAYSARSFRTPFLATGTYQFWFRTRAENKDGALAIHNLRVLPFGQENATAIPVPNGDFEFLDESKTTSKSVEPAGWSISGAVPVTFATHGMTCFDVANNRHGKVHLALPAAGNAAETTFTVKKAGRWRLTCLGCCSLWDQSAPGWGIVRADVIIGGETSSLGSKTFKAFRLAEESFPNEFVTCEGDEVTLRLTAENPGYSSPLVLLDDLTLVDAEAEEGPDLVPYGGFEAPASGWEFVVNAKQDSGVSGAQIRNYTDYPDAYGRAHYDGEKWCSVVQNDIVWRWITVPANAGGLYRLRFHAHSRADANLAYGKNPVKVYWDDDAGVRHWLGVALCSSTNFVEYAFDFVLPDKAAAYGIKIGFQGSYSHIAGQAEYQGNDHTTILDGVSLRRLPRNGTGIPELEGLADKKTGELSVANGAMLRLDYDGALTIGSLYLGGRHVTGEISAETHPNWISGPGKIMALERKGLMIVVR